MKEYAANTYLLKTLHTLQINTYISYTVNIRTKKCIEFIQLSHTNNIICIIIYTNHILIQILGFL